MDLGVSDQGASTYIIGNPLGFKTTTEAFMVVSISVSSQGAAT